MKKTSEKIAAFAANVASLTEALDEAADMVECLEAQIAGADALREINKKLGDRVDELEAKLRVCQEQLNHANALLETQRRLMGIPGYVGLMMYVSEFSQKHQISTSSVWDMFFSVCKRAVFTIPEAPEPVEPPVTDDFKECRGGFDCNGVPVYKSIESVENTPLQEGDKCITLVDKPKIKKGQIVEIYYSFSSSDRYYCSINGVEAAYSAKELRKVTVKP